MYGYARAGGGKKNTKEAAPNHKLHWHLLLTVFFCPTAVLILRSNTE